MPLHAKSGQIAGHRIRRRGRRTTRRARRPCKPPIGGPERITGLALPKAQQGAHQTAPGPKEGP
eukprot:4394197-Alexandrium_andersonii.AAC.1